MEQPQNTPLMDSLKEAIRDCHARMEALPFITALTDGQLPLDSYVAQLRAMAVIQGTLDHELSLVGSSEIRTLLLDRPSRLVHLRKDLSIFDPLLIPEIEASLEHTRKIAECIRRYRVEQPSDLLGILYVLEGTTLGNAVHLPDVLKIFGGKTSGCAHYYAGYGGRTHEYWQEFCGAMNALAIGREGQSRLIQVALDFFDQLEALFLTFYPIASARAYTAGMLNPEAGDHAVPGDAKVIEAAVTAARRCREEYPYFDERYQERGRSFAKSDASWLASLAELPDPQLLSQVEWLGRVLGNRGMPRITLERQLELLHDELAAAVPEKLNQYSGLLEAAGKLKGERFKCISEPVFKSLTTEFYQSTDSELQGRFKGTGALIVSAVCDQTGGITEAVNSLLPWLTDGQRFSPQWIDAVKTTFEQSRESLQGLL
ncbi:MAG: biliverdin-producing heme oxygenase [Desulfuromonadales bacterium]